MKIAFILFFLFFSKYISCQDINPVSLDVEKIYRIQSSSSFLYLGCNQLHDGAIITHGNYSLEAKSGQFWKFIFVSNGCYRIQIQYSGLYLTCSATGEITQEKHSVGALGRQLWNVLCDREGHYFIQSVNTRLYLTYFRRRDKKTDETKVSIRAVNIIMPEGASGKYTAGFQMKEQRKSSQYWNILPVE